METKVFYVAVAFGAIFQPTIAEKFDNQVDANCYASLMSRTKKARYIVLEQQAEFDGSPKENV